MGESRIITPKRPEEIEALRTLCWDYRDFLLSLGPRDKEIVETFYPEPRYRQVLDRVEYDHVPPDGAMRLAMLGDLPVGCGMVQRLDDQSAEIKRVYVNERARGTGLGRGIMEHLIGDCRALGFRRILLDTGRPLTAAQALYDDLGFVRRGPYQPIPEGVGDRLVFFELTL